MTVDAAPATEARKPLYKSLFVQVVVALLLGIVLGMATPGFAVGLKVFSDAFLKLISMIVAPIVFCVVVHGIAGAGDLRKVGRVGGKALLYFECMTTVALVVGLVLAFVVAPGKGMNIDTATLDSHALATYADNAHKLKGGGIGSFLLNIIPTTSFDALARNDVLQVLFFAIIFGVSVALVGEPAKPVADMIEAVSKVLFRAMGLIVRMAPFGVLGAVAYTVGQYGVGSLRQLLSLVARSGLERILKGAARATAIAIGPGLGRNPETHSLVMGLVEAAAVPLVLDADALQPDVVRAGTAPRILTPHAGELERISLGQDLEGLCRTLPAVTISKGPTTRICGGEGAYLSLHGGPVLSRGGSGDLLAGLAGGLLAQTPAEPLLAACRASVWHGMAADLLARDRGQAAVRVTQLLDFLAPALRESATCPSS